MSQDKKYTYITLPDGRRKRTPVQHGGKTVQEIDGDFETKRMKMNAVQSHDSWYDFLQIEPDYLVEKCKRAGVTNPETLDYVNTWADRVYNMPPNVKTPSIEEISTDFEGSIKKFEDKINGPYKDAVRRVYDTCDLRDNLPVFHKDNCETVVCNPFPINRVEDLPAALLVNPSRQKDVYLPKCIKNGYLCNSEEHVSYFKEQFTNIQNGGAGDCLFIAFANYLRITNECLNGRFLKPGDDISDLEIKRCDYFKIQSGTDLTQKLRNDVIRFLDRNRQDRLINHVPLRVSMASAVFEKHSNFSDKSKKDIYETFVKTYPRESKTLTMSIPLNSKKLDSILTMIMTFESPAMNILVNYLTDRYLHEMAKYSAYAGQIEIVALAIVNNVSIEILQENSLDRKKYERNMGYTVPGANVVYLHHTASTGGSGAHFDVMLPLPEQIILAHDSARAVKSKISFKSSFKTKPVDNLEIMQNFLLKVSPRLHISNVSDLHETLLTLDDVLKVKALNLLIDNGAVIDKIDDIIIVTILNDFIEITMKSLDNDNMKKCMHKLLILSRRNKGDEDARLQNIFTTVLNLKFAKIREKANKFAKSFKIDNSLNFIDKMEFAIVKFFDMHDLEIEDVEDPLLIKLFKAADSVEETEDTTDMVSWAITVFLDDIYYELIKSDIDNSYLINIIGIDSDISLINIVTLLEKYKDVVELDRTLPVSN